MRFFSHLNIKYTVTSGVFGRVRVALVLKLRVFEVPRMEKWVLYHVLSGIAQYHVEI